MTSGSQCLQTNLVLVRGSVQESVLVLVLESDQGWVPVLVQGLVLVLGQGWGLESGQVLVRELDLV